MTEAIESMARVRLLQQAAQRCAFANRTAGVSRRGATAFARALARSRLALSKNSTPVGRPTSPNASPSGSNAVLTPS